MLVALGESELRRRALRGCLKVRGNTILPLVAISFNAFPALMKDAPSAGVRRDPVELAKEKNRARRSFFFGGSEENRTPVRKPIHTTFFVDSLLFKIPVWEREQTRYPVR